MKETKYLRSILLTLIIQFSITELYAQSSIYELSIEELKSINIIRDTISTQYLPCYDINIKDLMSLEIIKELKIEEYIDLTYDIPLDELMLIKIHISRNSGIDPSYEMSFKGLTELEIKEKTNIVDRSISVMTYL